MSDKKSFRQTEPAVIRESRMALNPVVIDDSFRELKRNPEPDPDGWHHVQVTNGVVKVDGKAVDPDDPLKNWKSNPLPKNRNPSTGTEFQEDHIR